MSPGEERFIQPASIPRPRGRQSPSSYQYLLDIDLDLADELNLRMRLAARPAITANTFDVDAGPVRLTESLTTAAHGPGVLVLDGVLAVNVRVGDRVAAELLGPGDIVEPCLDASEDLLACEVEWRALVPMRFAVLDASFTERVRPWPQIMQALLRRAERRTRNLNVQRALSSQPRLEVRLALLLWHLAARWGRLSRAAFACRSRSPTSCWGGRSARSGRRSRTRWPPVPGGACDRARRRVAPSRQPRRSTRLNDRAGDRPDRPARWRWTRARRDRMRTAELPTRVIFRCQFCAAVPDHQTQQTLEHQLRELIFGEYLDVPPGGWLTWHGGGPLGPRRYACRTHRGELTAYLREHYGTIAPNPWAMPPYPITRRSGDTEKAIRHGGLSGMPKWGLS